MPKKQVQKSILSHLFITFAKLYRNKVIYIENKVI